MKYFSEDDVRRLLPMPDAIEAMRTAFQSLASGDAVNQPRRRMHMKTGAVLHALAGAHGRYFGTKVYSTHPRHGAWFTFLLFDAETSRPLAQFEANYLGQIRTGATSGLATDLIAAQGHLDVGVVGSGFQARSQLAAVAAVRRIKTVKVWSRDEQKRAQFAQDMAVSLGASIHPVPSAAEAIDGCQVIITATSAKEAVIDKAAIADGTLILAMGSNDPKRREIPEDVVRNSAIVVDDVQAARVEAGDLLLALTEDEWRNVIPLADLVSANRDFDHRQLCLFKSVGLGLEDVAAAAVVYERSTLGSQSAGPSPARR